jgi:peroxiredoxin
MSLEVGDRIPPVMLQHMTDGGPKEISTEELFGGRKVVLLAVPGAFTPTCSAAHLPGFVVNVDAIKAKGVDEVVCTSVNDVFVMDAWGKAQNAEAIHMVADGSGDFASALGLEFDLTERGLGVRSQRYAMIVNDGVVEVLNLDEPGKFEVSSAEAILDKL